MMQTALHCSKKILTLLHCIQLQSCVTRNIASEILTSSYRIALYCIALHVKIISSPPGTLRAKQITVSSSQLEFLQRAVAFVSYLYWYLCIYLHMYCACICIPIGGILSSVFVSVFVSSSQPKEMDFSKVHFLHIFFKTTSLTTLGGIVLVSF